MKILYLDPSALYINPTSSLFPLLVLSRYPDARFYGPGYLSEEELAGGLERWVEQHGPFDVLISGPLFPFFAENKNDFLASANFIKKFTVHAGFSEASLLHFYSDIHTALKKLPIPLKVVSSLSLDSYASTQKQVDRVLESDVVLLGPNHQFARKLAEWPEEVFLREKHYQKKKARLSDAWFDFLVGYPERVITACHYIGEHEFCLNALGGRSWDIAVPGAEYVLRRDAISELKKIDCKTAPKTYFQLFRVANKLGLPVYRHHLLSKLYNLLFQKTLFSSRMVFTSSGGSGNLPRKYLEIPAAGALLVCTPCNGLESIGFKHGVNCIIAEPSELQNVVKMVGRGDRYQDVADAGRATVMAHHSLGARAEQISRCLFSLKQGTYAGAIWEHGSFSVIKKEAVG